VYAWLVSGYAHEFILVSVVIVTLPKLAGSVAVIYDKAYNRLFSRTGCRKTDKCCSEDVTNGRISCRRPAWGRHRKRWVRVGM